MNERVQDLLADWEIARQEGKELSPEELCRECPELLAPLKAGVEKLLNTSWLFEVPEDVSPTQAIASSPASRSDLLHLVRQHRLVAESEIEKVDGDADADAESIAANFCDSGLLTQYQSDVLLGRKDGPLALDRYVVLGEIGEGGMGKVYKALHTSMKRNVAIKMLSAGSISDERKSRFRREIQTVAALNHPNIVTAYDACEVDGRFFLAMELIDGEDLTEVVNLNGPMDFDSAAEVVRQIAGAAEAAHQKGIIHRDIKPSNVVLTCDGPAKLLDLGIARIHAAANGDFSADSTRENSTEITGDNVPIGTIAFMSPEQALSAKTADERSDIYSLGCMFYYLLAGTPPFPGDNAVEVIVAHREVPIESVLQSLDIPAHGRDIINRMMAKDPDQRFASMKEVANAIEQQVVTPAVQRSRPSGSSGVRATWLFVGSLLLACCVVGVLWFSNRSATTPSANQFQLDSETWQNDLARWVLNHSGTVVAETEFGEQYIDSIEAVPNSSIEITELSLVETPSEFSVEWLTRLPKLSSLTIDLCELSSDDAEALVELESLQSLGLISCELDNVVWSSLAQMPKLNSLLLRDLEVSEKSLSELQRLTRLQSLTINNMDFSDADFHVISTLEKLEFLDLENTFVTSAPLAWAATNSKLKHLDLSSVELSDSELKAQPICKSLTFISFESCDVGSAATDYVAKLPIVAEVYLGGTNVTDADLGTIASCTTIKVLNLEGTQVSAEGLKLISGMSQLEGLTLAGLDIGDGDLQPLLKLKLAMLDLSNTKITDASLKLLSDMGLSELTVAGCDLTESELDKFMQQNPSCAVLVDEYLYE